MISMMPGLPQTTPLLTPAAGSQEKSGVDFAETLRVERESLERASDHAADQDADRAADRAADRVAGRENPARHEAREVPVRNARQDNNGGDPAPKPVVAGAVVSSGSGVAAGELVAGGSKAKDNQPQLTAEEDLTTIAQPGLAQAQSQWLAAPQVLTIPLAALGGKAPEPVTASGFQKAQGTAAVQGQLAQVGLDRARGPGGGADRMVAQAAQVVPMKGAEQLLPGGVLETKNTGAAAIPPEPLGVQVPMAPSGVGETELSGAFANAKQNVNTGAAGVNGSRMVAEDVAQAPGFASARLSRSGNTSDNPLSVLGLALTSPETGSDLNPIRQAEVAPLDIEGNLAGMFKPAKPSGFSSGANSTEISPAPAGTERLVVARMTDAPGKLLAPQSPEVAAAPATVASPVVTGSALAPAGSEVTARVIGSAQAVMAQAPGAGVNMVTSQVEHPAKTASENPPVGAPAQVGVPDGPVVAVVQTAHGDSGSDGRQFSSFTRPTTVKAEEVGRTSDSGKTVFSTLMHGRDDATVGGPAKVTAPAQAPPVPTAPALPESRIVEQVVSRVSMSSAGGETNLSMLLHPKELGEVRVELVSGKDGLRAHLHSQTQMVQEVLERNLPRLREAFESQGVKISDLQVSCDGRRDGGNAANQQREQNQMPQYRYRVPETPAGATVAAWPDGHGESGWSAASGFSLRV